MKTTMAVLGPELLIAPPCALGAIYCATALTPKLLNQITKSVSTHIVEPHLEWFESRAGSLNKAHQEYDRKKREALIARGEAVPDAPHIPVASREERSDLIADILTKGSIAMVADLVSTMVIQKILAKKLDIPMSRGVAFIESGVHLGGIALMAGPGAAHGENMHYWIKKKLEKFGVNSQRADDFGTAYPYIVLPGQLASLASLAVAQHGLARR